MNILFIYYLPSGGVETLNIQRSIALKKHGIQSHFLYYQQRRDLINNHHGPVTITDNDQQIKEVIEKHSFDAIVITSDYKGLERLRGLGYQGLLILEIQGLGPIEIAKQEVERARSFLMQYADGILLSPTPHIIEILNMYPALPQKFIFDNCLDMNQYPYKPEFTDSHPIVAWIGRFEPNKNWSEFILIGHKLIREYNQNIQLYMFEDNTLSIPSEKQRYERLVKELNIANHVRIFSNKPQHVMSTYYSMIGNSGGLLCSTSNTEGFGYAIVEAMACRCPVVSTRSDGVSQSIIHNHTGKYYTIGQITEAFDQCKELMTNQTLRKYLRLNAQHYVSEKFQLDKYANHFTSMIRRLQTTKK